MDANDNGRFRRTKPVALNDLVLEHRLHNGRIWMRAFPISELRRDADLEPMVRNYVDLAAGPTVVLNVTRNELTLSEQRWATRLLKLERCSLGGKKAVTADFELANADQLRLWPEARTRMVRLVLVRTGYEYDLGTRRDFPSLLLFGYSNRPEEFEQGLTDFEAFLSRVELSASVENESAPGQKGFSCSESLLVQAAKHDAASEPATNVASPAPGVPLAPPTQESTEPEAEPAAEPPLDLEE